MRRMERLVPRPPARSRTTAIKAGRLSFHQVSTEASRQERNVLYLHGGAYVSGTPAHYRHLAGGSLMRSKPRSGCSSIDWRPSIRFRRRSGRGGRLSVAFR